MIKKALLTLSLLLLMVTPCLGDAAVVTQVVTEVRNPEGLVVAKVLTFTIVADSTDGTIPDTDTSTAVTNSIRGWYLDTVIADPGATAPDDDCDVYINNHNGLDILGGNGVDLLHSATTKGTIPCVDSQNKQQLIRHTLTLDVDNQANVSATYLIILILVR